MSGHALPWAETIAHADTVRHEGIAQFARVLRQQQDCQQVELKWGDELEFIVLEIDDGNDGSASSNDSGAIRYKPFIRASELINRLARELGSAAKWNHEYGSYMIESTPSIPYDDSREWLEWKVEQNMRSRRLALQRMLGNERFLVVTMVNFPLLGADCMRPSSGKTQPMFSPNDNMSAYVDDSYTNNIHPRFSNLAKNIRRRRSGPIDIRVPLFRDKNTSPTIDHIHMDAMVFGMGSCCLQLTFQLRNITEARRLFDQFVVIAPIAAAISAACPIFRGFLSGIDCRWPVISGSVDDRTIEERNPEHPNCISKSRYASISRYLDHLALNDLELQYNQHVIDQLERDYPFVDEGLKLHLAHLFVRVPLVIYNDSLDLANLPRDSTEHFDNIQSTNWQTVRFKLPTSQTDGWKVEFRPMDIQLSETENAALSVWIFIFSRTVFHYNLDLCIPISLVDQNMESAMRMDAVLEGKFWWKTTRSGQVELCSIKEIFDTLDRFMRSFVKEKYGNCAKVERYLDILSERVNGVCPTNARFIRNFVMNHPKYMHNSICTPEIISSLIDEIGTSMSA